MEDNTSPAHKAETSSKKSFLNQLPPAFAFWAGVITTATFFFAAGCIILMIIVFKGVELNSSSSGTKTTGTTNTNTAAAAAATKVDLAGIKHVRGEGDYMIVEFSDTECPYCKTFHTTLKQTIEEYKGKVKWGYKHFPLSIHPKAQKEAEALECAGDQGKFWEYTDEIYARTPANNRLEDAEIYKIADDLGLDRSTFDSCLSNGDKKKIVNDDTSEAVSLGGRGTPFVLIVDKTGKIVANVPGAVPFDDATKSTDMKRILAAVLK